MRTLTVIVSGLVCIAILGCTSPKDDYDKLSAELVNSQQLVKEANYAHLEIAAEKRKLQTTLEETQAKLSPVQQEADELKEQLLASQAEHKKDVADLTKKNESLQTQLDTAVQNARATKNELEGCQSELASTNKKNAGQQTMITRLNLIIKDLRKSNATAKQNTVTPRESQK